MIVNNIPVPAIISFTFNSTKRYVNNSLLLFKQTNELLLVIQNELVVKVYFR